jgi:hypothetical protein
LVAGAAFFGAEAARFGTEADLLGAEAAFLVPGTAFLVVGAARFGTGAAFLVVGLWEVAAFLGDALADEDLFDSVLAVAAFLGAVAAFLGAGAAFFAAVTSTSFKVLSVTRTRLLGRAGTGPWPHPVGG